MHYSQFRAFHAVALRGGFSKAADHLGLTQPAVSDQVKKLEEHFNVLLFHRHKRVVRLTELGSQLFEHTQRMFDIEKQAVDLLSANQVLEKGHLNIASDTPLHVVPLIGRFRQQYPGITVSLRMGNSDEIRAGLLDFHFDIGVVADMPDDPRFHSVVLRQDPLVAFISKDHPLADRQSLTLRELSALPLVLRERGSKTRAHLETAMQDAGLKVNLAMEVQGREAVREAVAAGIGVGIVSEPEFGFDSRLVPLTLSDCTASMTESLVCLKEKLPLRSVAAFFDSNQEDA
ncbi:LysR substrate-binding domain-containing protein [Sneathiella chinensis]|uniref:Transcriptional regulator n=1 Tax=Sneathiella chinensis TaxID=349750 RepID=A0ABQ5U4M5_9PROT|nr:LysR substrate-binding domain-containing protein [Sneathiella chinensis]GLQ06620.1 transcriptional regulator [Sneathiella chinensis]